MKLLSRTAIVISMICAMLIFGCATTGNFMKLRLNMTKSEVIKVMGKPTTSSGSMTNKDGQVKEVWEYRKFEGHSAPFVEHYSYFWLFFLDDELVQWGKAEPVRKKLEEQLLPAGFLK